MKIRKTLSKKVNVFGKSVPVFVLVILGLAVVTAALLPYFGKITGLVTVSQGLLVDGKSMPESGLISYSVNTTSLEDPVIASVHYLDNNANVDAVVNLSKICLVGTAGCDANEPAVNYYKTNLKNGTLTLSKKNATWHPIGTETDKVKVTYSTNVATGATKVDLITGLPSNYSLVYYADKEFTDNGVRLVTPGQAYVLTTGSVIPISSDDGNLKSGANYCSYDGYAHCRGIKLWAIRTVDLPSGNTITWNVDWQSAYYFETDLLGWNQNTEELTTPVTVSAGQELDFVIVSDFPKMMKPGMYNITTTVNVA